MQHHVTPSLHRRRAPFFVPATSVAVHKAVRDFDGLVHYAAALGAHTGYELPKKAVKAGVTTVELTMSDRHVSLFFPDPSYRMLCRGKATLYDRVRPYFALLIAFICAQVYYETYNPPPTWIERPWNEVLLAAVMGHIAVICLLTCAYHFKYSRASFTSLKALGKALFSRGPQGLPLKETLKRRWARVPHRKHFRKDLWTYLMIMWSFIIAVAPFTYDTHVVLFWIIVMSSSLLLQCLGYLVLALMRTLVPCIVMADPFVIFVGETVRGLHWLPKFVWNYSVDGIIWLRESVCEQYHDFDPEGLRRFCPAPPISRFVQARGWLTQMFWAYAHLFRRSTFWQAFAVFLLVGFVVERITRRQTIWKVQLKIESQAFSVALSRTTCAQQETTTAKTAAAPILTNVDNYVRTTHKDMPVGLRNKYLAVCLLIAAGWADNRVRVIQATPQEEALEAPDTEKPPDTKRESLGDLGAKKRLLKTRNNTAAPNNWRKSIRVYVKSWYKLFDDVQRGQDRVLPGADEIKESYSGVVTGPEFFDITEGFEGNVDDEIAGVSRHCKQLQSTLTKEYISSELDPAAEARLEKATDIICTIVAAAATQHFLSILEWSLPKKWGAQREVWYQRIADVATTTIQPMLTGFVKRCELALPINKLPRLVGSMGMLCCAKDASVLCSIESLFKKYFPHLVVKGMTQDGVCARFAAFARRAKRLGLQILAIDMSAMDSSWNPNDRRRVRRVFTSVVEVLEGLLEAELQQDYVSQCAAKQRMLRWILKYIEVNLAADDAILFSGERGTSIGNRILMLIVWSAELLRVYGDVNGAERIRKMFYCPDEAHKTCTDERPTGECEPEYSCEKFPEDCCYDNNIGDGDDCALAIPKDMYANQEEFVRAYEAYYKLVEPCSAWNEDTDLECLSLMCINARETTYFVPKVARNIQRLVAHKIIVPPGKHFQEGNYTYTPTSKQYAEIATDLWQRSFALKHSMVSRHLNRAMFEYAYSKAGDQGTIYDADQHRLGKLDGDQRLSECLEQVRQNAAYDVSAYVMIKATNFSAMDKLSGQDIRALKAEWYSSDLAWSNLELTDDLTAHPDVLLTNFPIGVNVAGALGFKPELLEHLKRQLVKPQGVGPEMGVGACAGAGEESPCDGTASATVRAASVVVFRGEEVLCGYEPPGKPRAGMLSVPAGKLEDGESYEDAAIRELQEEAALNVSASDLILFREHTCGQLQCKQYCIDYAKSAPSDVIVADRLSGLKFRTAAEIKEEHAPAKIASCIKEIIHDGVFAPGVLGGHAPGLPPPVSKANSVGHTANGDQTVPASSQPPPGGGQSDPASEVKPPVAEAGGPGPLTPPTSSSEDFSHSHTCPVCATVYTHSHKHAKGFDHKPRPGCCPNAACTQHVSNCTKASSAFTSSDLKGGKAPSGSSPGNGDGPSHLGKGVGKVAAGKKGGKGLSHPPSLTSNGGKSHAAGPESKGKGKQSKGKPSGDPKDSLPSPQTGPAAKTPLPQPPCGPPLVGGSPAKAGNSGQQLPDAVDKPAPAPCPGPGHA